MHRFVDGLSAATVIPRLTAATQPSSNEPMELGDVAAVLARASGGDGEAFGLLVNAHARTAFRLAYRLTGDERDAEDVVQESFIRAYRQLNRFEARSNFGTWLHRIVVNCAMDALRSRHTRRTERLDDPVEELADVPQSDAPSPERLAWSTEIRSRVEASMASLTPQERVAFALRHYEGRSIDEIGRTLGVQKSAAKHAVFRAVRKIRAALEPLRRNT
jgi:RNA polymerase sigma-70 factor, ECF subfamily